MASDARRKAEEALAFMDDALLSEMPPLPTQVKALADAVRALLAEATPAPLHLVFADFPGPGNECVFIEAEDSSGRSLNAGVWVRRPDGLVALVVPSRIPAPAAPDELRKAAERLRPDDVEWIVNSLAELGVKIGDQFFFLYKGESLVYRDDPDDDEGPLYWRHVGKREFGECCHPLNDADPTRYGTVDVNDGRGWEPLPLATRGGE